MAIDLERLMREQGRRAEVEVAMPEPSRTYEEELYRLYLEVLNEWSREAIRRLTAAYQQELITLRDAPEDEINGITTQMLAAITSFATAWRAWAARGARHHMRIFARRVKSASGIDPTPSLTPQLDPFDLDNLLKWNVSLITDITQDTRGRIESILRSGLQARTPAETLARQIREASNIGKRRARRIAIDQTTKLYAALDGQRIKEMGVEGYQWQHSGKAHPRPEHVARDGDFIKFGSQIDRNDPPGQAPFCGCKRRMKLVPEA